MAYVYKKFTAQDIAIIPFNAHKQYNFGSASAASNAISHFNTKHTSESVSIYSGNNGNDDTINTIKYNQIDHLFYRDHLKNVSNKKDFTHYLKQRKDYYEKSNLLSIPSGLYGHNIRKKSFYLSSSNYQLVDDTFGNLIISGTNVNDYPNDVQQNVFSVTDAVTIVNSGTSSISINQSGGVTIYLAGTSTTGNRTLLQKGIATIVCIASNTFIISGGGLY